MDTLLSSGDHKRDGRGFPIAIDGMQEKIQQAIIRLTVPKGAFRLDPELGSLFGRLGRVPESLMAELAVEYAREALMGLDEVKVVNAVCRKAQEGLGDVLLEIWLEYTDDSGKAKQLKAELQIG